MKDFICLMWEEKACRSVDMVLPFISALLDHRTANNDQVFLADIKKRIPKYWTESVMIPVCPDG